MMFGQLFMHNGPLWIRSSCTPDQWWVAKLNYKDVPLLDLHMIIYMCVYILYIYTHIRIPMVGKIQSGPELPSSGAGWPGWMFAVLLCNDLHACDRSPVSTVFLTWHKCLQLVQWPGYVCWPIVTNLRPITVTHAWARPAWLLNTKPQTFESPMLLLIWMSVRRFVPWTLGAWFISRSNELPTWHFPTDQLRFGRCANCMLSSRMLCTRHGWHPKLLPASALRVHASRQLKPVNELIVPIRRAPLFHAVAVAAVAGHDVGGYKFQSMDIVWLNWPTTGPFRHGAISDQRAPGCWALLAHGHSKRKLFLA